MKVASSFVSIGFTVVLLILSSSSQSAVVLFDDFNRPDGAVGNGWLDSPDNNGGDIEIISNSLSRVASGGTAGIYRSVSFTDGLNVKAAVTEGSGNISVPPGKRFNTGFFILNSTGQQALVDGFGFVVSRSDSAFTNSAILIYDGSTLINTIVSSFQFEHEVEVDATINLDGSIVGSVTEGANIFDFSSSAYSIQSTGNNFLLQTHFAATGHLPGTLRATVDNLVLTSVPLPAAFWLFVSAMSCLVLSRKK